MNIKIISPVALSAQKIWQNFDEKLFLSLVPKFPPVKVLRFDGCKQGNTVSLELNFILFKNRWTSLITENGESDGNFWFKDQGMQLPFFLSKWEHIHRIEKVNDYQSRIVDDIHFEAKGGFIFNLIWYLPLYVQFWQRKALYRRYFEKS